MFLKSMTKSHDGNLCSHGSENGGMSFLGDSLNKNIPR